MIRWWWQAQNLDEPLLGLAARLDQIRMTIAYLAERIDMTPTRADLDAAKAALSQAITDAAARVAASISALQQQLANGNPITAQDLVDLKADVVSLGQIDAPSPPPTP